MSMVVSSEVRRVLWPTDHVVPGKRVLCDEMIQKKSGTLNSPFQNVSGIGLSDYVRNGVFLQPSVVLHQPGRGCGLASWSRHPEIDLGQQSRKNKTNSLFSSIPAYPRPYLHSHLHWQV